jgi:hypothetical protein
MSSASELIKHLARQFVTQHYPEETEDFDRIWELMPEDLREREAPVPSEVETRFWDQLIHSPYMTDIVINIIAAIIFELGMYSGKKLVGLIREKQQRAQFEQKWGTRVNKPELVAAVVTFVYTDFEPVAESNSTMVGGESNKET